MSTGTKERRDVQAAAGSLTLTDAASMATSIHGSLILADILRACRRLLREHFSLGRLSIVKYRGNESTATLYSLDEAGDAPLIGPKVIALENSRLKRCILDHQQRVVRLNDGSAQDAIEKRHLLDGSAGSVLYSPLMLRGRFKGVLVLSLPKESRLDPEHVGLLSYMTDHLALAIENSDMHYLEVRRGRVLSMVSEIAKQAVLVDDLAAFLGAAAELIRISLDYLEVQIWTGGHGQECLTRAAFACRTAAAVDPGLPPMVEDCARRNRILCNNNLDAKPDIESGSELTMPIRLRGRLLGVLFLKSDRLDAFPAEDLDTIEGIASLIASACDNLRSLEHVQESNEYMHAILESAKKLAVLSSDTMGYVRTSSIGAEPIFRLSRSEIVGKDILTLFTDPRFRRELAAYITNIEKSTLERIKLSQQGGDSILYLNASLQRVFDPEKRPLGFLCIVQDVTENVLLEQRLEALSITDELTGLFNRRRFFTAISNEMERCHRFRRSISLCFFDLDRFKEFNDTHGHLKGDQALKEAAQMTLGLVRSSVDTCYRYGGDEFTIIMPETTIDKAHAVAERIREQLSRHFQSEITASIGIASSVEALEAEYLVEKADQAMYSAKSLGGNRTILAE